MEAKFMKTSYSRAWECKPFTHGFLIFQITKHMNIRVQSHTSYTQAWASNRFSKAQAPLQQVHHHMRVWGNGEEGMREYGDR